MKKTLIPGLLLLAACTTSKMLTMESYVEIPVGSTKAKVTEIAGKPDRITEKDDGTVEYEYNEKLKNGFRTIQERRYVIVMRDGAVISKRVEQSSQPPYDLNSYDLQTTYGDESASPEE